MKVTNIRCHVGAQIGAKVYTSIDAKVNGTTMFMTKEGVFLHGTIDNKAISPHFIPHSTIASIRIEQSDFDNQFMPHAAKMESVEEAPKKRGRPSQQELNA
jgi:hypothetical protein